MRVTRVTKDSFMHAFKEELLKIPDLPLIDPEKVRLRGERNEKEGTI